MNFRDNSMLRTMIYLFFVVCAWIVPAVCAQEVERDVVVSEALLKEADLEIGWQVHLPMKKFEKIDRMFVFGKFFYALTDQNYLFCIDRDKGKVRFGLKMATPGLPVCHPQYYQGKLLFIIGNELVIVDPFGGVVSQSKKLDFVGKSTVCGAMRNKENIYIAGANRRLYALSADDYLTRFKVTADNDSLINSFVVDDRFVVFSTDAGNIVNISSQSPQKRWQFDITGKIQAPIVRDGGWVYVSGFDTKLYKLDITTGKKGWDVPFQTGQILYDSVRIGKKTVYQPAGIKGLYAVDKETGKQLWNITGGKDLLAESGSTAYVLAKPGILVVMDNEKNKEVRTVNFERVCHYVSNTADSTIYVADNKGLVASIKEIEY